MSVTHLHITRISGVNIAKIRNLFRPAEFRNFSIPPFRDISVTEVNSARFVKDKGLQKASMLREKN